MKTAHGAHDAVALRWPADWLASASGSRGVYPAISWTAQSSNALSRSPSSRSSSRILVRIVAFQLQTDVRTVGADKGVGAGMAVDVQCNVVQLWAVAHCLGLGIGVGVGVGVGVVSVSHDPA